MRSHEAFRRKLRHRLLQIAEARRRAGADQPSGMDLKVIARCESLAALTPLLDSGLCATYDRLRADPAAARRFAAVWAGLPEALGTTLWPSDAADLVAWMIRQAAPEGASSRRTRSIAKASARSSRNDASTSGSVGSVYGDLTGGFAVVAPVLAVWNVSAGLRQWHDRGVVAQHPGTEARVIAAPSTGVRGLSSSAPATIAFTPTPGAPECRIEVDLRSNQPVGSSIVVVPSGVGCATPLVTATIGDPMASFGLAAAFAATGVLALNTWCWLRVRADQASASRPAGAMRLAS